MLDKLKEDYEKLKEQPLLARVTLIILPLVIILMFNVLKNEPVESEVISENAATVQSQEFTTEPVSGISDETKDAISTYFKSDREPTIKDATWTDQSKDTLYVGVIDNKTNRDGVADYVCQVLISDFGIEQGAADVYVMDIAKIARDNKWVQLGKAKC